MPRDNPKIVVESETSDRFKKIHRPHDGTWVPTQWRKVLQTGSFVRVHFEIISYLCRNFS